MIAIPNVNDIVTKSISLVLLFFTYILPLLSTIRAVHNRDKASYHQWVTYFLLLFGIVNPLNSLVTFHPVFQITTILWLSLPRFQGAHFVYTQFIQVLVLDKYNVEERVDGEIQRMTQSVRMAIWNILQNAGWSALTQVGDVVGLVMALMPTADEGRDERLEVRPNQPMEHNENDDRDQEDDDDEDGSIEQVNCSVDEGEGNELLEGGLSESERDYSDYISEEADPSESEFEEKMQVIEPTSYNHPTIPASLQIHETSSSSKQLNPDNDSNLDHVSSFASLSSLRSSFGLYEIDENTSSDTDTYDFTNDKNMKAYLHDLTQMLQNGIYVYASHGKGAHNDNAVLKSNTNGNTTHRVSLFSYHPSLSTTTTTLDPDADEDGTTQHLFDCLVFGPKLSTKQTGDSYIKQMARDSAILPLDNLSSVRKAGSHAIEFLTASSSISKSQQLQVDLQPTLSKSLSGTLLRAQSSNSNVSEESFVMLMKGWSDGENKLQQPSVETKEDECLFAEVVLLDGEDRDTLFGGLRTLLKAYGERGKINNFAAEREKNDSTTKEDVKTMGSDGVTEEWVIEAEKDECTEEIDSEKQKNNLALEIGISTAEIMEEGVEDSTSMKGKPSDDYEENMICAQSKELDTFISCHENLIVDELVIEEDSTSQHSANKNNVKDKPEISSSNNITWGHITIADDQVLGDES